MTLRIISQQNDHPLYLTCNCINILKSFQLFFRIKFSQYNQIQRRRDARKREGLGSKRIGGGGLDNFAAG